MDRIGKILQWRNGVATVEVGKNQECAAGSCADCHAMASDRWVLQVRRRDPCSIGQKVLVKPRRNIHKLIQWAGFLCAFSLVLAFATWLVPGAEQDGPEQRIAILVGIAFGGAVWKMVRLWARGWPQFRIVLLEPDHLWLISKSEADPPPGGS